jgi:CRISPR/Cas system-associated exonuclease Cas4 (RecB family)
MNWFDQKGDAKYENLVRDTFDLFEGVIPGEESLNGMIINYLPTVDTKVPRRVRRSDGFHASSIGTMCLRLETLRRAVPRAHDSKTFPGELHARFQIGHAVHERWQRDILGKMRVLKGNWECSRCTRLQKDCFMPTDPCPHCRWQVDPNKHYPAPASRKSQDCATGCKWPGGFFEAPRDCAFCERGGRWNFRESFIKIEDYDIVGAYDGLVVYNGVERILEMKTKDVWAWDKMDAPHESHVIQANWYMKGTGVKEAVVAYINKNSGLMKEYLVKFDQKVIDHGLRNIDAVRAALEDEELPNGVCGSPREKKAKECAYSDLCFAGVESIPAVVELEKAKKLPMADA